MPIEVELPDGNTVEFPDGTDNATMERALRSYAFNSGAAKADFTGVQGGVRLDGRGAAPRNTPKATRPSTYNLTGMPGVSTQVGGFLDALQHRAMDVPHGLAQFVQHGVKAGTDLLPDGNPVRDYVARTVAQDDRAMREREAAYQARTSGNALSNAGAAAGMLGGAVAPVNALRAAGALPRITATGAKGAAQKGGLLALEGAAFGAMTPVLAEDYGAEKGRQMAIGALAAPAIAGGLRATGAGAKAVRQGARYVTPKGREKLANERVAQLLGGDDSTIAALRSGTNVPGYALTPAQALATPEAVQAERILRNNGLTAPAFAAQESANNAALRSAVAGVAKDDDALQAAIQARREGPGAFWRDNLALGAEDGRFSRAGRHLEGYLNSKPLPMPEWNVLDEARKITGQVQRGTIDALEGERRLSELAPKTKGGKKAMEQAMGILNQGMVNPSRIVSELEKLSRSGNKAISGAAADHLQTIAKNQDETGWIHARVLDDIRQNIGGMLKQHTPMGASGSKEGAAYGPLKAKIANTIDRAIPGYRDSLAAYARASQPINDMEAGRALLGAIDSGGRDAGGNQVVGLAPVKAMLARDNRANFPMSDEARSQIEGVLDALQRRSITNNTIAATGPGTAADTLRGSLSSPLAQRGLSGATAIAGTALGDLSGGLLAYGLMEGAMGANNAVQRLVGQKAASAPLAAEAIEAARRQQMLEQSGLLGRFGIPEYLLPYIPE